MTKHGDYKKSVCVNLPTILMLLASFKIFVFDLVSKRLQIVLTMKRKLTDGDHHEYDGREDKAHESTAQVIRLGKGQSERLGALGAQMGVSQAQLVRWSVEALLQKIEGDGGRLSLPITLSPLAPTQYAPVPPVPLVPLMPGSVPHTQQPLDS